MRQNKTLLTDTIEKWNMKFCVWLQILMKVICTWCSTKIFLEDKIVVFKKKHTSSSCYYLERSRNHITGFRICYLRTVTDGRNVPSEKKYSQIHRKLLFLIQIFMADLNINFVFMWDSKYLVKLRYWRTNQDFDRWLQTAVKR